MHKAMIFIDGENFRRTIEGLFPKEYEPYKYLPSQANWKRFFDHLVEETRKKIGLGSKDIFLIRAYWYVIAALEYDRWFMSSNFYHRDINDKIRYYKKHVKRIKLKKNASNSDKKNYCEQCKSFLEKSHQELMKRLDGWHFIQDTIQKKYDRVQF